MDEKLMQRLQKAKGEYRRRVEQPHGTEDYVDIHHAILGDLKGGILASVDTVLVRLNQPGLPLVTAKGSKILPLNDLPMILGLPILIGRDKRRPQDGYQVIQVTLG